MYPNSIFLIFQVSVFIKCIFRKIQCKATVFCRRTQITFSSRVVGLKNFFGLSTQIPNAAAHVRWIQQEKTQLSPVVQWVNATNVMWQARYHVVSDTPGSFPVPPHLTLGERSHKWQCLLALLKSWSKTDVKRTGKQTHRQNGTCALSPHVNSLLKRIYRQ